MYRKVRLDNGLRIITHSMPKMQSVALGIWIKAGGRYETPEDKGISHYLEHLLFKGSKKYSCRKLKESIEGVGGVFKRIYFRRVDLLSGKITLPLSGLRLRYSF